MKGIFFRRCKLPSKKCCASRTALVRFEDGARGNSSWSSGNQQDDRWVLQEFYWPGVQSDATRFARSCNTCQRTVPKHLVGRVPLRSMPIVETPFQVVAIDVVGPLSPTFEKGNWYVLTMFDYMTRYPDAIALPSNETERVAEALLEMFSHVGIPREIISEQGTLLVLWVMKELSQLLSFKQLLNIPYHPMANGLV